MEVLLSGVNFIRSDALIITSFNLFCQKFIMNVRDVFYDIELRWVSCWTVMKRSLAFRLQVEMIMSEKCKFG